MKIPERKQALRLSFVGRAHLLSLRRPTALALTALLLAGALLAAGCSADRPATTRVAGEPIAVTLATAEAELVSDVVSYSGSVEPWARVTLASKLLSRVEQVRAREGDPVAAGGVLVRLDRRDLAAAAAQARAAVSMAEAQLENARVHHERMQRLHQRGSVTDKNLEDAQAAYRVATAALEQAQANLEAAEVTLGYAEVRAPRAGFVTQRHVEPGDMAAPGTPLVTLEDLSRVKIVVDVPAAQAGSLARGTEATVQVDGIAGERAAKIERVVPAADPSTRTLRAEIVTDNPGGKLRSGMFARVRVAAGQREAFVVPRAALVERGQLDGLFVAADGQARLRWVRTGAARGERVEILSGFAAGDRYVVDPPPTLRDGSPIEER